MQNFNDKNGQVWGIRIDRTMLRKVKQDTGILLTDLFLDNHALLTQICTNPVMAGDVLWSCCQAQARERNLDLAGFEEATDGDCFEHAVRALIEATIDFFPNARRKDQLREMIRLGEQMTEAVVTHELNNLQATIDKLIRSSSTTNSKESSESMETAKP